MSSIVTQFSDYVSGADCLQYVGRDIGLLSRVDYQGKPGGFLIDGVGKTYTQSIFMEYRFLSSVISYVFYSDIAKIPNNHNNRIVGLILDEWDDGSFKVAILGNDSFTVSNIYYNNFMFEYYVREAYGDHEGDIVVGHVQPAFIYGSDVSLENIPMLNCFKYDENSLGGEALIPYEELFDYIPTLSPMPTTRGALYGTGSHGANRFIDGANIDLTVTDDKTDTLIIGNNFIVSGDDAGFIAFDFLRKSPYNLLSGDMYAYAEDINGTLVSLVNRFPYSEAEVRQWIDPIGDGETSQTYASTTGQTIPVNLILTRSEAQALAYLQNGTLPSDAFMFPLDWENIPQRTPENTTPDEGGDDPNNNESNPSGIEGNPTVDADPETTSSKLQTNNVYWLQVGQLQAFITWFWTQAGEIIELGDLWDRVRGLYDDLGSAVINVRFFPVNKSYIGGTTSVNSIILGMVEYSMVCEALNKANPIKITLGTQAVPAKYNSFADYSPYTELQLYLPFHGWQALDVDIFMGNSVRVKAIYDYMSGTCQYLIYVVSNGIEYLVNTCIVKLAVDIPITLQSKNDRDSSIFSNVANAMGNLIGAGASIATMNPIGLVMSTGALGTSGASSAPMKMLGTQGENGAFFAPNKCALYLKRPSYNRPNLYKSRVGFPCNKGVHLGVNKSGDGVEIAKGFTTVYNPTITFKGNAVGNKKMLPYESEVQEIYDYLEKGVIL